MPYGRYARKKGYRRRKRRNYSGVKKLIQRTINSNLETFHKDFEIDTTIHDEGRTPYSIALNGVATGDSASTRTGNQITVTGIYGKFVLTGSDTTNIVRIILYIPKNPTEEISTISITALLDVDKFTVLSDKLYNLSTSGPIMRTIVMAKNFHRGSRKGITTQYHSTGASDFSKNPIYLYAVSDSAAINDPTIQGNIRCYYKDA